VFCNILIFVMLIEEQLELRWTPFVSLATTKYSGSLAQGEQLPHFHPEPACRQAGKAGSFS
jgi:hypothetical protein